MEPMPLDHESPTAIPLEGIDATHPAHRYQLALVMPVYNEEACIAQVVTDWRAELDGLGIDYLMILLNDGSKDQSAEVLARFAEEPRIRVIGKANSGHGPTILMGYGLAIDLADWVFQTDSDNEMSPAHFAQLWQRRDAFDVLFGIRQQRLQGPDRRLISMASRWTVRLLFGKGLADVNTPYRLMRAPLLAEIVAQIPSDTFAPNVIISGTLAAAGRRICNVAVPHENRKTGRASLANLRLWKAACKSFIQTLRCRPKLAADRRPDGRS